MFTLHPLLASDCIVVGEFGLSLLLLHKDSRFPWCILVPKREGVREIYELGETDRVALMRESCAVSQIMVKLFHPKKMNVASLGNMVPQLHVHHIARYETDQAWPGPVWGCGINEPYAEADLRQRQTLLAEEMATFSDWRAV